MKAQAREPTHPQTRLDPARPIAGAEHPLLHLQKTVGNQAVLRLLNSSSSRGAPQIQRSCATCKEEQDLPIRRKVAPWVQLSAPGDPLELEADRVADQVMAGAGAVSPVTSARGAPLQRTSTAYDAGDGAQAAASMSGGSPLPATERAFFEPRFGFDLGNVRIHAGTRADEAARAINARAFTRGSDIGFAAGEFAPGTSHGRRLLAHELTHVVQQAKGGTASSSNGLVQRACEPAALGSVAGCTGLSGDLAGPAFLFRVGCDTLRTDTGPTEERRLRSQAALIPAGITVDLHGFASEEGTAAFNDDLSCARALAAQAVLASEMSALGKTVTFRIFKHGGVPGPRPDRRAVVLTYVAATPTPPMPSGLTVIPCSPLPKLLLSRPGGCSGGDDFAFGDHPTLGWGDATKVAFARASLNFALLNNMRAELGVLGGSEGLRMVSHFASGGGATLTHGASSPIGSTALTAGSFLAMRSATETFLHGQLTGMASGSTLDCNALTLPSSAVPPLAFAFSDAVMLKAIIGGTQGIQVYLDSFSVVPGTRHYTMSLRYVICDDFGVDTSDLYSPALISFWVLQHERTGFVPFMNVIDLTVPNSGTF